MTPQLPPVAETTGNHTPQGADLREFFSRSLARGTGGAQFAVAHNGELLVDVAGGGIDPATPVQVFSVSKLVVALAAAHAHEAGKVDLDAPLATYWPVFDRPETKQLTARHVLSHASGINGVDRPLTVEELAAGVLDHEVEVQRPRWVPGTKHGYHAFTYGALMAGVFRHGVGQSVQEYATTHVIQPAGADFWFGAPDDVLPSLAQLTFEPPVLTEAALGGIVGGRAVPDGSFAPIMADAPGFFTDPRVQQATWPAMSGVSTASSLVRIGNAALGFGVDSPLLPKTALAAMAAEQVNGYDESLSQTSRFGSGVELPHTLMPYLGGTSFGHQGAGGSILAIDPDNGVVAAYVSTHTYPTVGAADQAIALLAGVRQALGGAR